MAESSSPEPDDTEGESGVAGGIGGSGGGAVAPGVDAVSIGLVFVGGAVGTALREGVALSMAPVPGIATLVVNILGAFLLGVVVTVLLDRSSLGAHRLRVLLGTGVLGGFTTYSALATITMEAGQIVPYAAAYAVGTVVFGALATGAGIAVASVLHRRSGERPS
ncbi:fluoride efflux transporter FluC [Marisediminicola sp. LYQ134]|uniref:fluoride efflux transporter FluC n=1 Tax=unclassified Marisediminicola TaxID=2618316 RepID=UPI0039834550